MDFLKFWLKCIKEGWELGDGFFASVETICAIVTIGLAFKRFRVNPEKWKNWEEKLKKSALITLIGLFVIGSLFIAPYRIYTEQRHERESLTKLEPALEREIKQYRDKLADARDARTIKIETHSPGEDALLAIESTNIALVGWPSFTNAILLDLTLRVSNGKPLGAVHLSARSTTGSAQILDFHTKTGELTSPPMFSEDRKKCEITFFNTDNYRAHVQIIASEPTIVALSGQSLDGEILFNVARLSK